MERAGRSARASRAERAPWAPACASRRFDSDGAFFPLRRAGAGGISRGALGLGHHLKVLRNALLLLTNELNRCTFSQRALCHAEYLQFCMDQCVADWRSTMQLSPEEAHAALATVQEVQEDTHRTVSWGASYE